MRFSKLADACLYFLAGSVIFSVAAAFVSELSDGATAQESAVHTEAMSKPIIRTASEAADEHLASARLSSKPVRSAVSGCVDGVCKTAKTVKSNKSVRSAVGNCAKRVRRGIFGWRRR